MERKSLLSITRSDLFRLVMDQFEEYVANREIETLSLNANHVEHFDITPSGKTSVTSAAICSYQLNGHEKQCIDADLIICFSLLLSSHNTMGKCTSTNRFGLDHFFEQLYVDWNPYFISSCVRDSPLQSMASIVSDGNNVIEMASKEKTASTLNNFNPNTDFISSTSLIPYNNQRISSELEPRSNLKLFEDHVSYNFSPSVRPYINVVRSTDRSSLGVFVPLNYEKKVCISCYYLHIE
jgi:hypothetical protein